MSRCEIKNAVITDTMLGREDHGIFTFIIDVEFEGAHCGVGCYALDCFDPAKQIRVFPGASMELISEILDVVGVNTWEELKGKYIRVKDNGWGKPITEIGNLMKDRWINIPEFFKSRM